MSLWFLASVGAANATPLNTTPQSGNGGLIWPLIVIGVVVIALVVIALLAIRRRSRKIDREAYLLIESGARAGSRFPIEKAKTRIGSQEDNDLVLTDDHISRHHVLLSYERGVFTATDLNSLYGLFVDGKRVENVQLASAGKINLGNSVDLELVIND